MESKMMMRGMMMMIVTMSQLLLWAAHKIKIGYSLVCVRWKQEKKYSRPDCTDILVEKREATHFLSNPLTIYCDHIIL